MAQTRAYAGRVARRWEWLRRRDGDAHRDARARRGERAGPDGAGDAAEAARESGAPAVAPAPDSPTASSPDVAPDGADAADDTVPADEVVLPVTRDRIAASLHRRGYRYLVDERGEVCGLWAYRFFSFAVVRDQVLQVRGRWSRQASIERLWEILAFTDAWNRERRHPKCYVRVHDDGRVHVLTEVSLPVRTGLSDAQIDHHLAVGLAGGGLVFDALDELYPDPALSRDPS